MNGKVTCIRQVANVHPHLNVIPWAHKSVHPNGIFISSAVFPWQKHKTMEYATCSYSPGFCDVYDVAY